MNVFGAGAGSILQPGLALLVDRQNNPSRHGAHRTIG